MNYVRDGAAIYRESFSIIRSEADLSEFQPDLARVVVRMIHACGMTDLPQDIQASPEAASVRHSCAAYKCAPLLCATHPWLQMELPAPGFQAKQ